MLIPLSWLKDFVEIKLPLKDLMWKMTEAGLTCESYKKVGDETVLDVEVTANRPDWMSVIGVAREVAAIQGLKVKELKIPDLPKKSANFPIDLVPDFELFERWTGIVIKGIEIKPSPSWLAERIKFMGHEPICNIIDITNYVMYELGIPMHAFDYDEISGQIMTVGKSKGGEDFTSVDGISYKLPKDSIIINDAERLIDLAGIKGGQNSGIKPETKNVFLHVTIDNPALVRRASLALGLRSDASAIYERGPDKGGTVNAIKRATGLILDLTGGEIASDLIDLKKKEFKPVSLGVSFDKLNKVMGIEIPVATVAKIFESLNLSPVKTKTGITCTIPTVRGDIKIEEDLIEEVARIYGYNKFPQTLPESHPNAEKIPYYFDDSFNLKLKELMVAAGYFEASTLSLLSKDLIEKFGLKAEDHVKITNPVSLEYEYMRASLIPSLVAGLKINSQEKVQLFEINKIYPSEKYKVAGVAKGIDFRTFKGILGLIFGRLNLTGIDIDFETNTPYWHPSKGGVIKIGRDVVGEFGFVNPIVLEKIGIKDKVMAYELDIETLQKHAAQNVYLPVPENPPQYEDLTVSLPQKTRVGDVVKLISSSSNFIYQVDYVGEYDGNHTFHMTYQNPSRTLTNDEVGTIRKKAISLLQAKFGATAK